MSWTDHTLALPLPAARSAGVPEPTVQLPARGSTRPPPRPRPAPRWPRVYRRCVAGRDQSGRRGVASRPGDSGTEPLDHGASAAAATATAVAGAVGSALGTAGHAAGHAAGVAAEKVGTFARAAADKAAQKRAERAALEAQAERDRVSLDDALLEGHEVVEPPLPMLPPETAAAPTRDQSKLVMGIIAGFLAVVTLLGFWGVSRIGSGSGIDLSSNTPRPTVTVTGPPTTVSPGTSATPTETATEEGGQDIAILKATGFDPEGMARSATARRRGSTTASPRPTGARRATRRPTSAGSSPVSACCSTSARRPGSSRSP